MEYTVSGRAKKVNRLFWRVLPRFLAFKLYAPFLSESRRSEQLEKLHNKTAKQVAVVLMELEGLFLKLAQQMSTMSGILPNCYIKAFEKAQNHSNARPFEQIKARIELELNTRLESVFSEFNPDPIGTASIGQVHQAKLHSGEVVAVKVQHLHIEAVAKLDLELIAKHMKMVQRFIKIRGFDNVFEEVVKMIHEELDYEHEAQQISIISENLKDDDRVLVPRVFSEVSTKKVLVMEFLEGNKINDQNFTHQHGIDRQQLGKSLLDVFSKNIFIDGIFHADPHPGNVLVNQKGQLIFLDFGAVGTLSDSMKEGLIILMQASILKDENLMIAGFKKMGFIGDEPGIDKICKKIIRLLGDFLLNELKIEKINLSEIDFNQIDIAKVFALLKQIEVKEIEEVVKIPKDWVLLNRAMGLVLSLVSDLAPEIDIYKEIKPNLLKMAIQKESVGIVFKTTLQQQLLRMISLPRKIELFLEHAESGQLELNVKTKKLEVKLIYALIQQVLFAIIAFSCFYFFREFNNNFFLYGSVVSSFLFVKSIFAGIYIRRKLK